MNPETTTQTTDQEKIYNLTLDLLKLEKDKKAMVAGYNEEIKRIKGEIKSIVNKDETVDLPDPADVLVE